MGKVKVVLKNAKCVVCGETIGWDDSPQPPACFDHSYGCVIEAIEVVDRRARPRRTKGGKGAK